MSNARNLPLQQSKSKSPAIPQAKMDMPILNENNFVEWHNKIIDKLKFLKLYNFVEYSWKLKDIKPQEVKFYKSACEKMTKLLLSTTDKADQELIKLKTDQNIATAFEEICKKYEENQLERVIRLMNNLFYLNKNSNESGEEFAKKMSIWSKKLIKSLINPNDYVCLLIMCKLKSNQIDPIKYKSMEEYFKKNIGKLSLDTLETTILDIKRKDEDLLLFMDTIESNDSLDSYLVSQANTDLTIKKDKKKQISRSLQAVKSGVFGITSSVVSSEGLRITSNYPSENQSNEDAASSEDITKK